MPITPKECISYIWSSKETLGDDTQLSIKQLKSGEVIIAIAGSNSFKDYLNNYWFFKRKYSHNNNDPVFKVHGGFLKCWLLIKDEVEKRVKDLNPSYLTITGYSYGAALSILCMEHFSYILPDLPKQCITFGCPRVIGKKNFDKIKSRFNNTTLYQNGSDFVTVVPPKMFGFNHVTDWTHIGEPFKLLKGMFNNKYHYLSNYRSNLQ